MRQSTRCEGLRHFDLDNGTGERALLDLARGSYSDDAAFINDRYTVAKLFGLFDVMSGEQNGALLTAKIENQFMYLQARLWVEPG